MYKCLSRNSHAYEDIQTPSASRDAPAALEHIAAEHTNEEVPKV